MEDLSVKTKALNPAALAAAPGQSLGGADKDGNSSPADALAAAFSQFLRKAATKPDQLLSGARGQVLPFDISFNASRADTGPDFAGFERAETFAPRPETAPVNTSPRDDRRPFAQDSGSSAATASSDSREDHASHAATTDSNDGQPAQAASSAPATTKGESDGTRANAKSHGPDAMDNDERGRGRKKKLAAVTAKDNAGTPKEQAVAVLTGLAAIAASEAAGKNQADGAETTTENSDDSVDENRRLAGIANALSQLAKQSRGQARTAANSAGEGDPSAEDAAAEKDDTAAKKADARGNTRAHQAADLAERIGSGTRMSVEVTVTDDAKSLISRPTAALFAAHGDKDAGSALARNGGAQADGMPEQLSAGNMIPDVADDIAARLSLITGANGMNVAPQASVEGDKAAIQFATQGVAPGSGGSARALEAPSQTNAAQNAQRPAANFRAEVLEQVSVNIQKAIKDGADRISIQLRPAELGRIDVRIEVSGDGRAMVHVSADRADTLELLQRDARDLARSLQEAGLRADAGTLQFNLREQAAENRERRPHDAGSSGSAAANGAASETEEIPHWTPTVRPGRVDIRA